MIRQKLINQLILGVQQLNFDRVIIFAVGKEEVEYYLIVELYGKGNIILTDHNYVTIVAQNAFKNARSGTCYMQEANPLTFLQIKTNNNFEFFQKSIADSFNLKGQQCQLRYVLAKEFYIGGAAASIIIRYCQLSAGVKCKNLTQDNVQQAWKFCNKMLDMMILVNEQSKSCE